MLRSLGLERSIFNSLIFLVLVNNSAGRFGPNFHVRKIGHSTRWLDFGNDPDHHPALVFVSRISINGRHTRPTDHGSHLGWWFLQSTNPEMMQWLIDLCINCQLLDCAVQYAYSAYQKIGYFGYARSTDFWREPKFEVLSSWILLQFCSWWHYHLQH